MGNVSLDRMQEIAEKISDYAKNGQEISEQDKRKIRENYCRKTLTFNLRQYKIDRKAMATIERYFDRGV